MAYDDKLWKIFSVYIRLRDADKHGYCTCITSGQKVFWKECDAGHFIARSHKATKFNEQNVNAQTVRDNRFISGRQFEHSLAIDKKYGPGTAVKLLVLSRGICKWTKFEIDELTKHYKKEVQRLQKEKGL